MDDFLKSIKYFIFDVDGTLLIGNQALPFASQIIKLLQKKKYDFTILSNNSSYSIKENLERLESILDVKLQPKNICTSTHATIEYLLKNNILRCFIVGTPGMISDLNNKGISNDPDAPQAIVLGFDKTLTYDKIQRVALLLQKEKCIPFFATHPDNTCPTSDGEIPDVGSFLKMFEQSTGRTADIIFGKPNDLLLKLCLSKSNIDFEQVLVLGDRLETDIKMANSVGTRSVVVLTGETTQVDLDNGIESPTYIWKNLEVLYRFLKQA